MALTVEQVIARVGKSGKRTSDDVAHCSNERIQVAGRDRPASASAVARYYRIKRRALERLESDVDSLKAALREKGKEVFAYHQGLGQYIGTVDFGGVKVGRANKYASVNVDREELIGMVGRSEYRLMYKEAGTISCDDLEDFREFLHRCDDAGIRVPGKVKESVSGSKDFVRCLIKIRKHLSDTALAVLSSCAIDQEPRVGEK